MFSGFKTVNCGTEPSDLAVINGSRAIFNCSRDDGWTNLWTFYSVEEPTKEIQIFNRHHVRYPYNGSFWVDQTSAGHCNLMINVASFEDAGTYQCSRSLDKKFHAELIVLGKLVIFIIEYNLQCIVTIFWGFISIYVPFIRPVAGFVLSGGSNSGPSLPIPTFSPITPPIFAPPLKQLRFSGVFCWGAF